MSVGYVIPLFLAFFLTDEFQLVGPEKHRVHVSVGSEFTVRCHLSPKVSAVDMEIIWFKETNCVCLYKNKEVIEGRGYEGRVRLFKSKRGKISLLMREFREFDVGDYLCQVTCADKTEEITVGVRGEYFISSFFISAVCSLGGGIITTLYTFQLSCSQKYHKMKLRIETFMLFICLLFAELQAERPAEFPGEYTISVHFMIIS